MSCGTLQRTCLVALLAWISSAPNGTAQCADWTKEFGVGGQALNDWSTLAFDRTGVLGPPAVYAGLSVVPFGAEVDCVRWDADHWSPLVPSADLDAIGKIGPVHRLFIYDGVGPPRGLYECGGLSYDNHIRRWNGEWWLPVGSPIYMDGTLNALEVYDDGGGAALFAGGWSQDLTWNAVWKLTGDAWLPVDPPYAVTVFDFAVFDDGSGPALYAACGGGGYTEGGRILRRKGTQWEEVGGRQFDGHVLAVEVLDTAQGAVLCAGGKFRTLGGMPARGLAVWDGTSWSELGGGVSGGASGSVVQALQVAPDGPHQVLYIAGSFDQAGEVPAANIARWDGERWTALGEGIEGTASSIVPVDGATGRSVWVGGSIQSAGGSPSVNVARWDDACTCIPQEYCTAKTSSQGCTPSISANGTASASSTQPCWISVAEVPAQTIGLFVYGLNGPAELPFLGGTLCLQPPLTRTPAQTTGGDPQGAPCSGALSLDVNAWIQSGVDPGLVSGNLVAMQAWFRDGGDPAGAGMSDAVAFKICD
jgi:hypothetical protein